MPNDIMQLIYASAQWVGVAMTAGTMIGRAQKKFIRTILEEELKKRMKPIYDKLGIEYEEHF